MYTKSQLKAIETPVKDILVSAGAGSGKTTVLTERIMQKLEKGYTLNDFLIVTFTKASAADLRKKLGTRLQKLADKNPNKAQYRKMLYALPSADIGTIDSFCLRYVKENAPALGLHKGATVGEEAYCDELLTSAIDSLVTELCEEEDKSADLLLDNFASFKHDRDLIKVLFKLYKSIRKFPFYKDWFEGIIKSHEKDGQSLNEKGFFATALGAVVKELIAKQLKTAGKALEGVCNAVESEKENDFYTEVAEAFENLERSLDISYEAYCDAALTYKVRSRPRGSCDCFTDAYNLYKEWVDKRKKFVRSAENLAAEYEYVAELLRALAKAMERVDSLYSEAKKERGVVDFTDAEQLFLSLLLKKTQEGYVKTSLCRHISASYKEVFIDEYQDVSPLQDAIFSALGKGKRFMVGDVKQSIYRFRDAYPDIFTSYRDSFEDVDAGGDTARIYLNENFRCDENIINFCNYVFDRTFTLERGGTDYTRERLVKGKKESGNDKVKLSVLTGTDENKEAEYVAEQVVKCIYEGYEPHEIAVLTRKIATIKIILEALSKRGIPVTTEKSDDELLKQPEVLLATALLKTIDNPTDDIALAAIMRSPIFRFTAEELLKIRGFGGSSATFYDNVVKKSADEDALGKKCAAFTEKLGTYRAAALTRPADNLLWYLYEDTNMFLCLTEGKEKRQRENLLALYEMAKSTEQSSYKGLSLFVERIRHLEEGDKSPKVKGVKAEGAVSVMTIHGSKGLEFPVVFVAGTGGNTTRLYQTEKLLVDYRRGISLSLVKQKEGWRASPILRDAFMVTENKATDAEEYRLLYVAFTRAERRLYISAAVKELPEDFAEDPTAYTDLFLPVLTGGKDESYELDIIDGEKEIPVTILASAMARAMPLAALPPIREDLPEAKRTTAKYAVSTVKRLESGVLGVDTKSLVSDKIPVFAGGGGAMGARIGVATHAFMQFADFALAEQSVSAEADRLLARGFISAEDRKLIDEKALCGFFGSELYGDMKKAKRLYREKRFTTQLPSHLFGTEGEDVLVQGVIDCFYENADGSFTLVDYKTDRVKTEEELTERYGTQLYLYSLYINKLTGKKVSGAYIYSLCLGKSIPCETEKYGV